jgi:YidC/Oxa1 family membrane protein insertase
VPGPGLAAGARSLPMNQTRSFLLIAWLIVAFFLYMEWARGPVQPESAIQGDPATAPLSAAARWRPRSRSKPT